MELHAEAARQDRRNVPLAQADHRPVGEIMATEHIDPLYLLDGPRA